MTDDLQNLANHVTARRDFLEWSQQDVVKHGGPSDSKQTFIEGARPPSPAPSTRKKIETALGWKPGSVREVLAGGTPTVVFDPRATGPAITIALSNLDADQRAAVEAALSQIDGLGVATEVIEVRP